MAGIKPEVVGGANKTNHASSQKGMAGSKKICHRLKLSGVSFGDVGVLNRRRNISWSYIYRYTFGDFYEGTLRWLRLNSILINN